MYTASVDRFGDQWRVSVYRDGALLHRSWFRSELGAWAFARSYTNGIPEDAGND